MQIENLKKQLAAETALLQRINERLHKSRVAVDSADRALSAAQAELKKDQVQAVLEERDSPSPELRKKLSGLQNALHHSQAELEGAREAQRLQAVKVDVLAAGCESRELEAHRIAFEPARKELFAAFATLIAAAVKVDATLAQTGPADLDAILFPLRHVSGYEWPDFEKNRARNELVDMFNAALRASRSTVEYNPATEIAA